MVYWTRRGLVGLEATASEFATQCQNPTLLFFSSILFVSGFLDTEVSVAPTHVSRLVGWSVGHTFFTAGVKMNLITHDHLSSYIELN